jgi:hypothetical protein
MVSSAAISGRKKGARCHKPKETGMKQLTSVTVMAIVLCIAGGANAYDGEGRPVPPTFEEIDANSDQLISRDEIQTFMQDRMSKRGGQGHPGRGGEGRFGRADTNGDGFIDPNEFTAVQEKMLERRGAHHRRGGCENTDE